MPHRAVVSPAGRREDGAFAVVLILGVGPLVPFDDRYRGFLGLVAEKVGSGVLAARRRRDAQERMAALAALNRAKDEFFAGVSHEFRTPLTLMLLPLEMLGRELNVDNAHYAEVDRPAGLIHVRSDYTPDGTAFTGSYPLRSWGGELLQQTLGQGRILVVSDIGTHDIDEAGRAAWLSVGARAVVEAPLIRDDTWVAHLAVLQDRPRDWTPDEIDLVEETAARTWAFVERARAEAALRDSEERLRMAIRTTGIVTWEWAVSDDRITTSDNFATVYGLPALAGAEEGWALVVPDDAARHIEKVRAVAAEGGSYTSEFRIRRPDDGRIVWLEERAEARVGTDGAVERVIGVTLDITQRKQGQAQRMSRAGGPPEAALNGQE